MASSAPSEAASIQSLDELMTTLGARGFVHARAGNHPGLTLVVERLGRVLLRTDVRPSPTSRSLVCSKRRLGPHTDHFRADYVAWECVEQAGEGGETFIVDPVPQFEQLPPAVQQVVRGARMYEHRIFSDDPVSRPIVSDDRPPRLYFTYWLSKSASQAEERAARQYRDALEEAPRLFSLRLEPGDLLIVDNRRLLHGREAFVGTRRMSRVWVTCDETWEPAWLREGGGSR